jgi:hypothetical protein
MGIWGQAKESPIIKGMGSTTVKSLYDTDFVEWTAKTAALLREGRIDEIDIKNLAEEIEDLGKSDRSAVRSQLGRMIMHLIKQKMQPERDGSSWRNSVVDARREIRVRIEDSPSLRRHLRQNLEKIYTAAVQDAVEEMQLPKARAAEIPAECPYTLDELLEGNPKP